jgi:hypothetical protein
MPREAANGALWDICWVECAWLSLQFAGMSQGMLGCDLGFFPASLGCQHCQRKFQVYVPLIFNDHVVKNDTSFHDLYETFLVPKMSWATNNSKPSLQSTESSLYILLASFLCLCKLSFFVCFGSRNGLHKCSPRWRRQDSSPLCSHGHSLCSCKPELLHLQVWQIDEIYATHWCHWEIPAIKKSNAISTIHGMLRPQAQLLDP